MKKSCELPFYCQILKDLRKENGYTQNYVATQISVEVKTYRSWEIGYYKDNVQMFPKIDNEKLEALADLYNVSIDYILGRSKCTSVENEKISEITGLNDVAIDTLASWYTYQENMKKEYQQQTYFPIEILNILLANKFETQFLLESIQDLLMSDYKIPAYHNGKFIEANINEKYNKCLTPQYVVSDSPRDMIKGVYGSNDTYLLTLVKDKTKTWDNVQIALNDDFFESIALKSIEKHLLEIKNDFQNKESDD